MSEEVLKPGIDYQAPATYEEFVTDLRRDARAAKQPALSPRLFSGALNIDLQALAIKAHVHRVTVTRNPSSDKLQNYLRDALRVLRAATEINGNLPDALFWFRNEPISAFEYRTPEDLVSAGRADDLLRYVRSLEAGAVG